MKALKWVLWGAVGLVVLVIVAVAIFAATFDPNAYKPRLVDLVKQRTGRTLTIDGTIKLTFLPRLGADVGKVTVSEPNSTTPFLRVDDAHVSVALRPLISRRVVVDRVTLTGLAVDLVRHKDGRTNFDDLTGTPGAGGPPKPRTPGAPSTGAPMAIDVGRVVLRNASIGWRDERDGTSVRLANLNLETGRLASGVPGTLKLDTRVEGAQPRANLQIELATGYRFDLEPMALALSATDLKVVGEAAGFNGIEARVKGQSVELDPKASRITLSGGEVTAKSKDGLDVKVTIPRVQVTPDTIEGQAIAGDVKLVSPQRTVEAKLRTSPISAQGKQVQLSLVDVDLATRQGDLAVHGKIATPVTLDLGRQQAQLPKLAGDLTVSGPGIPNKSLKASLTGAARADWGAQNASAEVAARLDESNIQTRLSVSHWSQPAIAFDVTADRLNVDRYLPPKTSPPPAGGTTSPAPGGSSPGGARQPEQPFDLSALKTLNAAGTVKIGALQVSNLKAEQVALGIKAAGGKLDVNPMSAALYQGTLAGALAVNANTNGFAAKQKLSRISIGPLLRDAANKDLLEGRGDVALDVTTTGLTVSALKKALAGNASVALRDGAIKGIDIPGTVRTAKAMLGQKKALEQLTKGGEKTDFSELTASFVIKNGVARNDDLQAKSPLLRLTGGGTLDIGEGTMDYTAKATLVGAVTGQGGKDLSQLAGLTVPVRVTGPFESPRYTVDLAELATDLAQDTLQRELQRRLGGKKGAAPLEGGAGAVGDALRGLFGKPK
jgi:AsmA protein